MKRRGGRRETEKGVCRQRGRLLKFFFCFLFFGEVFKREKSSPSLRKAPSAPSETGDLAFFSFLLRSFFQKNCKKTVTLLFERRNPIDETRGIRS